MITVHQRYRQTDRQTDNMQLQDHAMHYSASRGKNDVCYLTLKCEFLLTLQMTRTRGDVINEQCHKAN